jgi:hypothetical protein
MGGKRRGHIVIVHSVKDGPYRYFSANSRLGRGVISYTDTCGIFLSDPNVNVAFYVKLKWYNLKIVSLDAQTLK